MNLTEKSVVASRFNLQTAAGLLIAISALYFARDVLIPIALAFLLSFLLAPAMVRLQRWGLRKTLAALIVIALSFLGLILICWAGFGQAYNLTLELPAYRENISTKLRALTPPGLHRFGETRKMLGEVTGELINQNQGQKSQTTSGKSQSSSQPIPVEVRQPEPTPMEFLEKTAGSVLRPLATGFVVLVFVIFMLLGKEDLRDRVLRLAGSSRLYMTTQALDDAARRVSRYLLMQFAVNATYGTLVGLGLLLIGIPHPLVWAVLATLLRFIPYVGPWIAAAGPMLLAIGVAPGWNKFAWTLGLYVVLETVVANFVEPFLYGSSTGISAIAILVAAVFWTWLWGPVGLLLSTPLTVCLVVVGRYVPHLEFLGILFGDEPALSPAQRFYQRMIAKDAEEAAELTEQLLKDKSPIDVYDEVIVPAMSLAEDGRHAGVLDSEAQVYFLENTRELVDEIGTRGVPGSGESRISANIICLPAKDAIDELACQILAQLLPSASVQVMPLGVSTDDLKKAIHTGQTDLVCISGVPPQATRHVALRCRHLRKLFPGLTIMAAVWSDADLTSVRSRIPVSDANHVVCTLKQAIEYIANIENPTSAVSEQSAKPPDDQAAEERISALDLLDTSNTPVQEVLDRIVQDIAKTLNAPIAVLSVTDEKGEVWKSQSGLPSDLASGVETIERLLGSSIGNEKSTVVIEDMAKDQRFASSSLLSKKGIQFCAGEPLLNRNGKVLGSLLVLDTRTRNISQQEEELLHTGAKAAVEALEVRAIAAPTEAEIKA